MNKNNYDKKISKLRISRKYLRRLLEKIRIELENNCTDQTQLQLLLNRRQTYRKRLTKLNNKILACKKNAPQTPQNWKEELVYDE